MTMPYDGDIKLAVTLTPKDIQKTSSALRADLKKIFDESAGTKTDAKFKKMQADMARLDSQAESISRRMDELANKKIPTGFYAESLKQLKEEEKQLDRVLDRIRKLEEYGGNSRKKNAKLEVLQAQAEELRGSIENLKDEMSWEQDAGRAFTVDPKAQEEYRRLSFQLNDVNNKMVILKSQSEETGEETNETANKFARLGAVLKDIGVSILNRSFSFLETQIRRLLQPIESVVAGLRQMISTKLHDGIRKLGSAFFGLRTHSTDLNKSLKQAVKTFIKYAFGVRSFFFLWRKLRTAVKEGFGNLAVYSQPVNSAISNLMTSLAQLKNSFAAAFAPIATYVLPLLNALVNGLITVINAIGQFIAALTGKSTFTKAKRVQQDYAASIAGTANSAGRASKALGKEKDAAEDLERELAGFDDVTILQEKNDAASAGGSGGGGGGGGAGGLADSLFEEVPIANAFTDFADQLKDLISKKDWESVGALLAEKVNAGLQKLYDLFDEEAFKQKVTPYLDAVSGVFNSFVDNVDWDLLGRTVGEAVNDVVYALERLVNPKTGINWNNLGNKLAEGANGLVKQIKWDKIGSLIGNGMMVLPRILSGFAQKFDWGELGRGIGKSINAFFQNWSLSEITFGLATFLNGIFTTLLNLVKTINWDEVAQNIIDGINTFIETFDWKGNAKSLNEFLINLLDTILEIAEGVDWEGLGNGIGTFISNIDWGGIFTRVVKIIWNVISGIWSGLGESAGGRFLQGLLIALAAWKAISFVGPWANKVASAISGKETTGVIGSAVKGLLTKIGELGGGGLGTGLGMTAGFAGIAASIALVIKGIQELIEDIKLTKEATELLESSTDRYKDTVSRMAEATGFQKTAEYMQKFGEMSEKEAKEFYEEWAFATASADNDVMGMVPVFGNLSKVITDKLGISVDNMDQFKEKTSEAVDWISTDWQDGAVSIGESGAQIQTSYEQIKASLDSMYESGEISRVQYEMLSAQLQQYATAHKPVQEAFDATRTSLGQLTGAEQEAADASYQNTQNAISAYNNFEANVKTALEQIGGHWGTLESAEDATAQNLMQSLDDQIDSMTQWEQDIKTLTQAGVDQGFLNELIRMGPQGTEEIQAALEQINTEGGVDELNAKWQEYIDAKGLMDDVGKDLADAGVENVAEAFGTTTEEIRKQAEIAGSAGPEGVVTGIESGQNNVNTAATNMGKGLVNAFDTYMGINSPSRVMKEKGQNITQGLANGVGDSSKLSVLKTKADNLKKTIISPFENITQELQNLGKNIIATLTTAINAGSSNLTSTGNTASQTLLKGMSDYVISNISSTASAITSTIQSAFNISLYSYGQSAANTFKNGLQSVHIPVPHIQQGKSSYLYINGNKISLPQFQVSWYKRGGLFDKASIIGVGEAGSEAVLPLENQSAMTKIASSLASALAKLPVPAVATGGVVPYSVSKQDAQQNMAELTSALKEMNKPAINMYDLEQMIARVIRDNMDISFYMGDEQVARHAQAGAKKLDRRFNTVSKVGGY